MRHPANGCVALSVLMLMAGCVCPDSFREVPEPRVNRVADVAQVSRCQMQHYGATLLARADSAALVHALVQAGASVRGSIISNGKAYAGNPLVQAEQPEVIRALLRCGADVNAPAGAESATPLCAAVRRGQHQKTAMLIDAGAMLTQTDAEGESPLYIAAVRGDTEMCRMLLGAGAAVDIGRREDGISPLLGVLRAGYHEQLSRSKADEVALLLLDAGAQTAQTDADGNTALHYAGAGVVDRVLATGVSPDTPNHLGRTPLFFCKERAMVDALLRAGAQLQARDSEGASAFDVVPSPQVKSYLLFRGCRSGHAL